MQPAQAADEVQAREAVLARLERLHPRIIDLSLARIHRLLEALGRPQTRLPPVVHVAGTNGKGSVLAYMRAALQADGYRVHVYTSPHLVRFNERIRLAGRLIDDATLLTLLDEIERANAGQPITFFEATTAAALLAFAAVPADVLLLETGLGGRLDATNVVERPLLTAITPVSHDHQQFLGHDLAGIAAEKAGILKPGVTAVLGPQPEPAARAIAERAAALGAPLVLHGRDWSATVDDGALVFASGLGRRRLPSPGLAGSFQASNAGLAVACLERLEGLPLSAGALARGLAEIDWPARLQPLRRGPLVDLAPPGSELWLDGGHNPGAGVALAESLEAWPQRSLHLVFGMLDSKDPHGFLAPLARLRPQIVSVPIGGGQACISADTAEAVCRRLDLPFAAAESPAQALSRIAAQAAGRVPAPRILICGSLYLAGEVLAENG